METRLLQVSRQARQDVIHTFLLLLFPASLARFLVYVERRLGRRDCRLTPFALRTPLGVQAKHSGDHLELDIYFRRCIGDCIHCLDFVAPYSSGITYWHL